MKAKALIAALAVGLVAVFVFVVVRKQRDKQAAEALRQARAAFGSEKYEEAIEAFERCASLNSKRVECWLGAGHSHLALSRFPDALASYDQAVKRAPSDFAAYSSRATTNWLIGKPGLAEADYKKALELNPSHGLTMLQLDKVFTEQKKFDEAARFWSERAKSKNAGWSRFYWMQSLYLAGRWPELKEMTKDQKDPFSQYYAGAAELRIGSKAEARRLFEGVAGKVQFPDPKLDKQYGQDMVTACAALKDQTCVKTYRRWLDEAGL